MFVTMCVVLVVAVTVIAVGAPASYRATRMHRAWTHMGLGFVVGVNQAFHEFTSLMLVTAQEFKRLVEILEEEPRDIPALRNLMEWARDTD